MRRLERNNRQIRELRILYPTQGCPIPARLGSVSYSFLAPALREALNDSGYASVTSIVPGEADDWCTPYANDSPRSIVFSDDTDLLLFDYPAESLVVFFRNVELWPEPKFKGYSPAKIRQSLRLASLVPLAYSIVQEPSHTFMALLQEAQSIDTESEHYLDFSRRYSGQSIAPAYSSKNSELRTMLQHLDVRISEFAHQALDVTLAPTIYLPLLVEDANQASAWNIGQDIRLLAYSLLALDRVMVQEYKRKAQATTVQDLKPLSPKDAHAAAAVLQQNVETWLQWMDGRQVPQEFIWPLVATNLVLVDLQRPPRIPLLMRVLEGDFDNTWDFVHLTARIQAALYSLRFLKQCIAVWTATRRTSSKPLEEALRKLQQDLASMPTIAELFIVPGQEKKSHNKHELLREVLQEIYASLNIEIPAEQISNRKLKKQKREAERKDKITREANAQQNNIFAVLGQM